MATKKMPISQFVEELEKALNRKDGYIMGSRGQNPKKWKTTSWWFTQYTGKQKTQALKWRENAERVWDCNGMAEGIYEDFSGVNINTKARYNYSGWCDPKGTGTIPAKYRVTGAAVFKHSSSAGYITHVGYLYKPVKSSEPDGDWYIIEAKGVMYGVVKTKLSDGGWNRWGWMTKYFDYSNSVPKDSSITVGLMLGDRVLKNGSEGEDVKQLQSALIRLGYDCGKWGADGDFGDSTEKALKKFQKTNTLTADGVYGEKTHDVLEKVLSEHDKVVENPKIVEIVGGNCYVRSADNTSGKIMGTAIRGKTFPYGGLTSDNGWHLIEYKGQNGWVSGKYSKLIAK